MQNVEVFTWTFPGAPVAVQLDLEVVARLERLTGAHSRAAESGGVLLGQIGPDGTLEMTGCEPAVTDGGTLSEAIVGLRRRLSKGRGADPDGPRVLGYYRTLSSDRLVLEASDLEILRRDFRRKDNVVLLVKPEPKGPAAAGFFFWDGEELYPDFCFLEFPLHSAALPTGQTFRMVTPVAPREEMAPREEKEDQAPVAPVPLATAERAVSARSRSKEAVLGAGALVTLCLLGGLLARRGSQQPARYEDKVHQAAAAPVSEQPREAARESAPPVEEAAARRVPASAPAATADQGAPRPTKETRQRAALEVRRMPPLAVARAAKPEMIVAPPPAGANSALSTAAAGEPKLAPVLQAPPPVVAPPAVAQFKPQMPPPAAVPVELPKPQVRPENTLPAQMPAPRPLPTGKPGRSTAVTEPQPIRQVQPAIPPNALKMLSKEIVVAVQLHIDESGNVVGATYKNPGGTFGKYFAERAVAAARLWKFEPARIGTQKVPSDKVLEFRFSPLAH